MVRPGNTESTIWRPNSQQNARALRSFKDAMEDIRDIVEFRPDTDWSAGSIRNASRKVAIELRKLMLDGTGLMSRVLFRPRFQPLRDKAGLVGDVYENSDSVRIAPATEDGRLSGPLAERTWGITVHPLHGLRFNSAANQWIVEQLFNTQAQPLALSAWLNQRLFAVDERVYSLRDTLKYVADREAAHADLKRDDKSRDMERVHFGHTTYPQFVAVMVATYVLKRYRTSRTENAKEWDRFSSMEGEAIPEYKIVGGWEFSGHISPMGFGGEFHDTGIQIPVPGKVWNPVQIREHATVRP